MNPNVKKHVDRGLEITAELARLDAELKGINQALELAALNGEQVDLNDADREGKQFLARGSERTVPVVISADLVHKSFADGGKTYANLQQLAGLVKLREFYAPETVWKARFSGGKELPPRCSAPPRRPLSPPACSGTGTGSRKTRSASTGAGPLTMTRFRRNKTVMKKSKKSRKARTIKSFPADTTRELMRFLKDGIGNDDRRLINNELNKRQENRGIVISLEDCGQYLLLLVVVDDTVTDCNLQAWRWQGNYVDRSASLRKGDHPYLISADGRTRIELKYAIRKVESFKAYKHRTGRVR
jgi:hypothetical protein